MGFQPCAAHACAAPSSNLWLAPRLPVLPRSSNLATEVLERWDQIRDEAGCMPQGSRRFLEGLNALVMRRSGVQIPEAAQRI